MRRPVASALALAAGLVATPAPAHEVGLSRGDYTVLGASVRSQVVFARKELIGLVAGLDANHDGALTDAEISSAREAIEGSLVGRIQVKGDGVPCPGTLDRVELAEQDGVTVHAVHRCGRRPRRIDVELAFLVDLSFGHRHLARASAGAVSVDRVLSQRAPSLSLDVPEDAAGPAPLDEPPTGSPLRRGALQVLARPWAPAFLLGLLASSASRRAALLAGAAFVAAAALGLYLGARGHFLPSPGVLGTAVALSLVYVGLEAIVSPRGTARWAAALPFGLVHGLAGAAALQGEGAATASLVAFGGGVVLAQAAVIGALAPATAWMRRRPALAGRGVGVLGAAITAVGAIGLILGRR